MNQKTGIAIAASMLIVGLLVGLQTGSFFSNEQQTPAQTAANKPIKANQNAAEKNTIANAAVTSPLVEQLSELKSAAFDQYAQRIESVIAECNDVNKLVESIRQNVSPSPGERRGSNFASGWSNWTATDPNGTSRPYQLYAPESVVSGARPTAVIVHLHGAVGRPDFGSGTGNSTAIGWGDLLWSRLANEHNFLIVCPLGRSECAWWTDNGVSHINAVIRDVKRTVSVPDQSIFGAGFSDGASGCYYLSMVAPDPFAGFIAMNGHMAVAASASKKQVYLQNMQFTPLVSAMTQEDSLYPSKSVLPHITQAIAEGAPITVLSYPNANHQPSYFDEQVKTFENFLLNTKRNDDREQIRWMTAEASLGKAGWLEIQQLGATNYDCPQLEDRNLMTEPGRIRLGVQLKGHSSSVVSEVVAGSSADNAGFEKQDVVIQLGKTPINGSVNLRMALAKYSYGDEYKCIIERAGERETLTGKIPDFIPAPQYLRDKPTSHADCVLSLKDGKARVVFSSRNVQRARVWLPDSYAHVDEIEVVYGPDGNTNVRTLKVNQLSARELLQRFADRADSAISARYIEIEIE